MLNRFKDFSITLVIAVASAVLMCFCVGFRKNDYMTGAFLLVYVFAPVTLIEIALSCLTKLYNTVFLKRLTFYTVIFIFIGTILFTIYYAFLGREMAKHK
jgi:hypothetical protein